MQNCAASNVWLPKGMFHMFSHGFTLFSCTSKHCRSTCTSNIQVHSHSFQQKHWVGHPKVKGVNFSKGQATTNQVFDNRANRPPKKIRMRLAQVTRISRIEILEFKLNTSFAKYILHLCQHRQRHQSHQWEACQFSSAGWAVIKFVETLRSRLNPG